MLTADLIKTRDQDNLFAVGGEYVLNRLVELRAGFNHTRDFTAGIGLNFGQMRVDYAFSDNDLGAFNKVSFTWAWHNIYQTDIEPPMKEGRAVYPLKGFENEVVFKTEVPDQFVAGWDLAIQNHEGKAIRTLCGDLRPPAEIVWDAKNHIGEPSHGGTYSYVFTVNYKNGKKWAIDGKVDLDMPEKHLNEVIDMNLQLNGAQMEVEGPEQVGYNVAPAETEGPEQVTEDDIEKVMEYDAITEESEEAEGQ